MNTETPPINYTCSLGALCFSSQLLKRNHIKLCSYPFDWIFSNTAMILHCLEDNFKTFLYKSYYISPRAGVCNHTYYNTLPTLFNHHNPILEKDYAYFERCVSRFNTLLQRDGHKLFVMVSRTDTNKNGIIMFNTKLATRVSNYTLLHISIEQHESQYSHTFTYKDNIHFLEVHILSRTNGVEFINDDDNKYLDSILMDKYRFELLPVSS